MIFPKRFIYICLVLLVCSGPGFSQQERVLLEITPAGKGKVNTRIDNIGYWKRMVQLGYVRANSDTNVPEARFIRTQIMEYIGQNAKGKVQNAIIDNQNISNTLPGHGSHDSIVNRKSSIVNRKFYTIRSQSSPDIPVTSETNVTQSENSVFIDPVEEYVVLNSNNSTSWVGGLAEFAYGADALYSMDGGLGWLGSTQGTGGNNAGDPSTAIGLNGWWYVGKISADFGQSVSYSKNQGKTWTRVKAGNGPPSGLGLLDKNHLWIDNSPTSPYAGHLYDAWTNFIPGSPDTNHIQIVRSTNQGLSWTSPHNISEAAAGLILDHGVNIHTGPDGEVYVAWSIYDTWPSDETAIGFTKSIDGGSIFTPATRIISNIKGIRNSQTGKNMRVNSFPSMAVDISTGPNRGTIYLVWCNVGFPGINTGTDIDVYLIKSTDEGETWSAPVRVNQDPAGLGKQHFFPWISCDPITGGLCVVYYDDRNLPSTDAATFVSYSYDGGVSWTDMQVSDYTFTPWPIAGLAYTYFGDYIGIQSRNMKVYPVWTDNHDGGRAMSYVSPFDLGPNPNQPWVVYYSNTLASVSGSGSTSLNFGDSLYLSLGLKNTGDQMAANVTANLSCASPYITVTDSLAFYDTIGPGQIRVVQNGYTFRVSDTIPDNLPVRFDVTVTGSDSVWYSHFAVLSHAPALQINSLSIVDTAGNFNNRLEPGETVTMVLATANTGDIPCAATVGRLTTTSPWLTIQGDSVFLDTIQPHQVKNALFTVAVSPDAPFGTGADLEYTARSGFYVAKDDFREMIGLVVEDWETNGFDKFSWQAAGSAHWVTTDLGPWEGMYCARSGILTDHQTSQLILTYTSATTDSISFYLKTSSEEGYDYLRFYIDGIVQGLWSGDTPWMRAVFPVSAGEHVYKWIYAKDLSFSWGQDRAWLDFIAFPPPILPEVDPGPGDTICAGMVVELNATASQYDSIRWTTTGDGVFSSDTSLTGNYTPGTNDLIGGSVNLRLTGYGTYGSYGKNKEIRIGSIPVAAISVFPRDTVCAGQQVMLSADTAGIAAFLWNPGNVSAPELILDTALAGGVGTHLVHLTVTSDLQCQNRDSIYITFRDCTGLEEHADGSLMIYPNPGNGHLVLSLVSRKPGPASVTVTSSTGTVVFTESYGFIPARWSKSLDLSHLPEGMYILTIQCGDGTRSVKVIVRKA